MKHSEKQVDFVMEKKAEGYTINEIKDAFNSKFKKDLSYDAVRKIYRHHKDKYEFVDAVDPKEKYQEEAKEKAIKAYQNYIKKNNKRPSISQFCRVDRTLSEILLKSIFGNIKKLDGIVQERFPEAFDKVVDEYLFTKKNFKKLEAAVKGTKRFLITTAVTGKPVHKKALTAMKVWENYTNGQILIMPCSDPASIGQGAAWSLAPELAKLQIVFDDLELNENLTLSSIKLTAKQINPLTGLARLTKGLGSVILAAPKQHLLHTPVYDESSYTNAIMTTGAITLPDYNTSKYMSERTGYLAEYDHCLGGIIVELEKDGSFHFRQIQFEPKSGSFIDLDKKFSSNGNVYDNQVSLIRPGDYHSAHIDPTNKKILIDILNKFSPEYVVIEDFNDGFSINPFNNRKNISRAIQFVEKKSNLFKEFELMGDEAEDLANTNVENIIFIRDNHSLFLDRYLEECKFKDDKENLIFALELASGLAKGFNVTQYGIEALLGITNSKFKFLVKDESFAPNGIENSIHGHIYRGRRSPALATLDIAYGACNAGHDHSAKIYRDIFVCGTLEYKTSDKVEYLEGASNWTTSMIFEHSNGSRQIVNIIKGKYRLED